MGAHVAPSSLPKPPNIYVRQRMEADTKYMKRNEHGERIATTEAEAKGSCSWCERMDTPTYNDVCVAGHGCKTENWDSETLAHNVA
jgi:hypothetical protein